ncbi:MAG: hypothetical protein PHG86_04065 [Candidatus Methanomethylophilaceae archaeon]|nr:hypothetical protein [Candidatus Methanomethylophilaceae archaeon]
MVFFGPEVFYSILAVKIFLVRFELIDAYCEISIWNEYCSNVRLITKE